MKKTLLIFCFSLLITSQAAAFNIDPTRYEYMGQNNDRCGVFYEIATAKAVGDNASIVMIEADPRNRTLRYYYNVIDPINSTVTNSYCEIYDYNHQMLEKYKVSDKPVKFEPGDLIDTIYNDLVEKGIVEDPRKVVPEPVYYQEPTCYYPPPEPSTPEKKPGYKVGELTATHTNKLTGGKRINLDSTDEPTSSKKWKL